MDWAIACAIHLELHFALTFQSYTLWNACVADRRTGHVIVFEGIGGVVAWLGEMG
jgi:hypothetical protein